MSKEKESSLRDKKLDLLKEAIKNTQSIISILDVKVRFLLAINLAFIGGILLLIKVILGLHKNYNHFSDIIYFVRIVLFVLIGITLICLLIVTHKLMYNLIYPKTNPFDKIMKTDEKYKNSPFFPVLYEDCFDFKEWKDRINSYEEEDIYNIYVIELLKVSYIRDLKTKKLNNIIDTHYKWIIILICANFLFLCIFLILHFLIL